MQRNYKRAMMRRVYRNYRRTTYQQTAQEMRTLKTSDPAAAEKLQNVWIH